VKKKLKSSSQVVSFEESSGGLNSPEVAVEVFAEPTSDQPSTTRGMVHRNESSRSLGIKEYHTTGPVVLASLGILRGGCVM
jgi:hypothetical protein